MCKCVIIVCVYNKCVIIVCVYKSIDVCNSMCI